MSQLFVSYSYEIGYRKELKAYIKSNDYLVLDDTEEPTSEDEIEQLVYKIEETYNLGEHRFVYVTPLNWKVLRPR